MFFSSLFRSASIKGVFQSTVKKGYLLCRLINAINVVWRSTRPALTVTKLSKMISSADLTAAPFRSLNVPMVMARLNLRCVAAKT